MTAHELIQSTLVDPTPRQRVDSVKALIDMGNAAYWAIDRFLKLYFPGERAFVLVSDTGYAAGVTRLEDSRVTHDVDDIIVGLPVVQASVLWSFLVTEPSYN
jgi:hypothetical protein